MCCFGIIPFLICFQLLFLGCARAQSATQKNTSIRQKIGCPLKIVKTVVHYSYKSNLIFCNLTGVRGKDV